MAAAASPSPGPENGGKKRDKAKKRAREEDALPDAARRPKKSRNSADAAGPGPSEDLKRQRRRPKDRDAGRDAADAAVGPEPVGKEDKKAKKRAKTAGEADAQPEAGAAAADADASPQKHEKRSTDGAAAGDERKKSKRDRKGKPKRSKSGKHAHDEPSSATVAVDDDAHRQKVPSRALPGAAGVDEVVSRPSRPSRPACYQPPDMPADTQFPFFSQTVSLYEPLYPTGWAQPVTNSKYQHLQHLVNKYVPALRGVLLDYKNVALGPAPGRGRGAAADDVPTTVVSRGAYAVGFGWITADVELFVPSRGAWMEGSVNLQTEGHIGVVCFGKFNASIEARRLPPAWKWVSDESPKAQGSEETAPVATADDHGVVRQVHSTGFWIDGDGARVTGKTRFRIRNFDAGTSGDTSYLSLEGTMLDRDGEKRLVEEEARAAPARRPGRRGQREERQRAPEFSMTRFAGDGAEDQDGGDDVGVGAVAGPGSQAASEWARGAETGAETFADEAED